MEDVGEHIRAVREGKGLTLRSAAQAAGLAVSTLSNMERGRHAISVTNLIKIAQALGVSPESLLPNQFEMLQQHVPSGRRLRFQYYEGIDAELLTPPGDPSGLSIFLMSFDAGAETPEAVPHREWEHIYIIEGALEARIGDQVEHLEGGDFVYFTADRPHWFRAKEPTRLLTVAFGTGWLPGRR